jgi:hypothetical protein
VTEEEKRCPSATCELQRFGATRMNEMSFGFR